jgi:hypothetical protein
MSVRLALPPRGVLKPNDADDPLPYYYHPLVGWLYRHRLQMGLDFLPPGGKRVLEIGVGSGVLVPTLTKHYAAYTGTDLTLAPGLEALVARRSPRRRRSAGRALRRHRLLLRPRAHPRRRRRGARTRPRAGPRRHAGHRLPDGQPTHDPGLRPHRLRPHRRSPRQSADAHRGGARRRAEALAARRLPARRACPGGALPVQRLDDAQLTRGSTWCDAGQGGGEPPQSA